MSTVLVGGAAQARDLVWDYNGTANDGVAQDGSGTWDKTTPNWILPGGTATTGTNTAFVDGDSVTFGSPEAGFEVSAGAPYVDVAVPVVVNNFTLNNVSVPAGIGSYYEFGGAGITLQGNLTKNASGENRGRWRFGNNITLTSGVTHTIAIADTNNDLAEINFDGGLSGDGALVVNNGAFPAWGTLALNQGSPGYTGQITINKGRIVLSNSGGLGSTAVGTTIENAGTLGLGGAGTTTAGMTVTEPINITRNTYTGPDFDLYGAAVFSDGGNNTISGPLTLNTTDARFRVGAGQLTITTDIPATAAAVSKSGGGVLFLTGTNSHSGGTRMLDGTVAPEDNAALGAAGAPLTFDGGFLRVPETIADTTAHPVTGTFNGGFEVLARPAAFTVSQAISGSNFTKRGPGALNFAPNSTNAFTGRVRFEGGTSTVTGGAVTVTGAGGFDNAMVIAPSSTASLVNNGGTVASGDSEFVIGNGPGAVGAYTQTAGAATANNWFVVGRDQAQGTLVLSGGTITKTGGGNVEIDAGGGAASTATISNSAEFRAVSGNFVVGANAGANGTLDLQTGAKVTVDGGEFWVGNGNAGPDNRATGVVNMTGGAGIVVQNNWVAIGREGGNGTVNMNGATFTKNGGGNFIIGDNSIGALRMQTGANTVAINSGDLWVGQAPGGDGTLDIGADDSVTVNNRLAIGRENGKGVINLTGGTLTKLGGGNVDLGERANGRGSIIQTGGTFTNTVSETYIAEGGTGLYDLSGGRAILGNIDVGRNGENAASTGELRIRGTGSMEATRVRLGEFGQVASTVNLSGGSLVTGTIVPGANGAAKTFNFTGGRLTTGTYELTTPLSNSGTGTLAPGGAGTVGTTAVSNAYNQAATAAYEIDIAGTASHDLVTAVSSSVINGLLSVDLIGGYTPIAGSFFDVLTVSGGTLTGSPVLGGPDGSMFTSSIVEGDTLRLTAVPEPTGLALAGLAAAGGLLRRRRRAAN